jgi:lipoprotein-releasing system permease protein
LNLSLRIARRYFLFGRKLSFINIISIVTILIVALVTIALVFTLSVFNGMEGLIRDIFQTFDAEIRIAPGKGKTFVYDAALLKKIKSVKGIHIITEVIEDDAFLLYDKNREVIRIKGVSDNFIQQHEMDSLMIAGKFILKEKDSSGTVDYAVVGYGIRNKLNLGLRNRFKPVQVYYPNKRKIKRGDPQTAFNIRSITASGFFGIEKRYDDSYVFVPLSFAQDLMDYDNERSSLEIKVVEGYNVDDIRDQLREALGTGFVVQNSDEQHVPLLRAVQIEKLFIQLVLTCIYGLASINIFFSLSLLAINKKKDVAVLSSMGASPSFIRKIFITEGVLIAFTGVVSGLILGLLACELQRRFGLISLGIETALIESYPIEVHFKDVASIVITVFVITVLASLRPAWVASGADVKENL